MSRLVFLLEERSMKVLLEEVLPRFLPETRFLCIAFDGKRDLEANIPRKLRAWREPGVRFIVVRDKDGADCVALKHRLNGLCAGGGRTNTLVRIACHELESWYFGEPQALAEVFNQPELADLAEKARFRVPDDVQQPAIELEKLVPEFQKISAARQMGARLSVEGSRSKSFQVFLDGVRRVSDAVRDTDRPDPDR